MIDYSEAKEIILRHVPGPQSQETVPLRLAIGRILATDILSDVDMPPFNKAAMDGFAVLASDLADTPATLNVVMDVPAGDVPEARLEPGQAASVMTGAPVPEGADAVVQVEWTSGFGSDQVVIEKGVSKGKNLSPRAEIMKEGDVVLKAGIPIGVEEVGLLATVGCDPVPVFDKPSVAVLSTGDEVVPPSQKPGPAQIRDSNGPALESFLRELGLEPVNLGQVADDPKAMYDAVARGMEHECLLVTGGVSAGAYDFVEDVLAKLGVEVHTRRVAIKPGKPTVFGTRGDHMVFGLPGNPVSAVVISRILVEPALSKRLGCNQPRQRTVNAILTRDIKKKPDRLWFMPAILSLGEEVTVEPLANRGSADLVTSARSNCLVVAPQGTSLVEEGTKVDVVIWDRLF